MNVHSEPRLHDQRVELAKQMTISKPLIRMRRGGGMCLARVAWAQWDRIRVRRLTGIVGHPYAALETISFEKFVCVLPEQPQEVQADLLTA